MRRLPIIPTLLVLIAVGIMIRLGFWQVDRMHQKNAMLAQYSAAQAKPELYPFYRLPDDDSAAYRRVAVWCERPGKPEMSAGYNAAGVTGWAHHFRCAIGGNWLNDPIKQPDVVWQDVDIVIGWSKTPAAVDWKGGKVEGVAVPGAKQGYKIVADPPLAGLQPNARPDPRDIPNNHWSYAIQWFLFAGVALVIYGLALRKRLAARGAEG